MAKEKNNEVVNFVNPLKEGVNYEDFKAALGTKSVKEYCEGNLSKEEIDFVEKDYQLFLDNPPVKIKN